MTRAASIASALRGKRLRWGAALAASLALGAAIGVLTYEGVRDVEPRIISPRDEQPGPNEEILLGSIPFNGCETTDPPSPDFNAGFICRPDDERVSWVAYYRPRSAFDMGPHIQNVAEGLELNADGGSLLPEGSCRTPPAINEWRRRGDIGNRLLRETDRSGDGRMLCYRGTDWAAIEWTDRDASVYAVAFGPDLVRLREWWETEAGPRRPS